MVLFLIIVCFIAPCLSAPTNETSEPALSYDNFKNRIDVMFTDWRANFEKRKPYSSVNEPKECYTVQKPELNLNFTCVQTNTTVSMKPEDVKILLNNTELVVNIKLEFEIFIDIKIKVIGDINGTKVEKDGFMRTVVPKMTNSLYSKLIYEEPYITKLLACQQNMDVPKFIVTIKDIDIGQDNIEVAQNALQSNFKERIDKEAQINLGKESDELNEVNEVIKVKPITLERVLIVIKKFNDPTFLFA